MITPVTSERLDASTKPATAELQSGSELCSSDLLGCHPCNGCEHVTTTAPDGCLGDPVPHINCNRCGRLLLKTEPVTTCRGEWSPSNIIAVEIPPLCIKLQLDLL